MSFDWAIALSDLDYGAEEEAAALRVLRSKWLSMGMEVQAFEKEFAALIGAKHAFAVANGTAALHLAYAALGIAPGDEVAQPAINFVAAANMTIGLGATPVFTDIIALDEPTIDPADLARRITPKTKAIVVMHYGGYLCRMAEIQEIAARHKIPVIEDACHAVGARYVDAQSRAPHGRMAGNVSDIACFSFFSNKNIAVGEGGMITTDRDDLAERLRLLRSHGMTTLTWDRHKGHAASYNVAAHGYNYRLDEIHAALGRAQLAKLLPNNARRVANVRRYREQLGDLPGWILPFKSYTGDSACHLMTVVAPDEAARQRVAAALKEARIQTSLHYPCITEFTAFSQFSGADVPNCKAHARRAISLPLYPTMTAAQVDQVCGAIRASA